MNENIRQYIELNEMHVLRNEFRLKLFRYSYENIVYFSDIQPPTVDRCISPSPYLSRAPPLAISWEDPLFSDNSGKPLAVWKSHEQPYSFPLGSTDVIYEVKDETGNNNTCVITITVHGKNIIRKVMLFLF